MPKQNVDLQKATLTITEARFQGGTTSELDVYQARSTLEQTEATIPEFEITLRTTTNQLCILMGMPPEELDTRLGTAPIPTAPVDVAVGIPADLLRRRPDVRRAERQAAAQSALIGVAAAEWYPAFSINGNIGYASERFPDLFKAAALNGSVGPSFQWNLLNYGRILNNVRLQDGKFRELVFDYQQAVLNAANEVENGLVTFLRAQRRTKLQSASVTTPRKPSPLCWPSTKRGPSTSPASPSWSRPWCKSRDVLTQAQGEIATGLIQVYEALGGGWEIRLCGCETTPLPPPGEAIPAGQPNPKAERLPTPEPPVAPATDAP